MDIICFAMERIFSGSGIPVGNYSTAWIANRQIFTWKPGSKQGFTVIQAVVLAEFDGLHMPNAYGDLPLIHDDPAKPNENYFKQVDYIIDRAAEKDLVIGLLPTWGDKIRMDSWGKGPVIFNPENALIYGRWLGNRYKDRKNIIWILGGDRNPENENELKIWRSMAAGILEGTGGKDHALITFHPQPNEQGSAQYFFSDEWLSFNMFQNGHCRNTPVYQKIYACLVTFARQTGSGW